MGTALVVGAVLLGLVALALAAPVDVAFAFAGLAPFRGQTTIRGLFGLLRFRLRIPGADVSAKAPAAERKRDERRKGRTGVFAVARRAEFRRRVFRLIRDLVAAVRVRELRLHMRLGLGDPAETGRLWAFVGPLSAAAQKLQQAEVNIEPDFIDAVVDFRIRGRVLLIPLQVLVLAAGFVLSPVSLRAWRTLRSSHA